MFSYLQMNQCFKMLSVDRNERALQAERSFFNERALEKLYNPFFKQC